MEMTSDKGELIGQERLGFCIGIRGIGAGVGSMVIIGCLICLLLFFPSIDEAIGIVMVGVGLFILPIGLYAQYYGILRTRLKIYENGFTPYTRSFKDAIKGVEYFIPWERVKWIDFLPIPHIFQTKKHEMYRCRLYWKDKNGQLKGIFFTCYDFKPSEVSASLTKIKETEAKYIKERGLTKPPKLPPVSTGSFC